MNGRLEHELQINQKIETMLLELPDNVRQFYNNIRISKSPKTCIEYIRYIQNFIGYSERASIEEITDIDIQEYLNSIQYVNKNGEIKKHLQLIQKLHVVHLINILSICIKEELSVETQWILLIDR